MEFETVFDPSHLIENNHVSHQAQGPHGTYSTVDLSLYAQFSYGSSANYLNPDPDFFETFSTPPMLGQYDFGSTNNEQGAPSTPMGPPARPRKKKAPTLRAEDWEPVKSRILELHITQGIPLPKVKKRIEDEFGFVAELRQYRTRISQWGKDKNIKSHEMSAIVRKRQHRNLVEVDKGELAFEVRGVPVEPQKIERWMKRNDVPDSLPYAPSPAASTPSAIGCRTISEVGSPATDLGDLPMVSVLSPGILRAMTSSPGLSSPASSISSPALSISNIVRPQGASFTGGSPAPIFQSLPRNFSPNISGSQNSTDLAAHTTQYRYRQDEEERLQQELSMEELIHGIGHPNTLIILHSLGEILIEQGRYKSAEEIVRKNVENCQLIHGNGSPQTLATLHSLGTLLGMQGHYSQSEKILRRIWKMSRNILGVAHPDTIRSMNNLGGTLFLQRRLVEAGKIHQEALTLSTESLGEEHLDTINSLNGLARVYREQGRPVEAIQIYNKTLPISKRILGPEDAYTLRIMQHMASASGQQGDYERAEEILKDLIMLSERVLGSEHPDTLIGVASLATVRHRQRRFQEAEDLSLRALEKRKKVLGETHPHTVVSLTNLATIYDSQGRWAEAEELRSQLQRTKESLE